MKVTLFYCLLTFPPSIGYGFYIWIFKHSYIPQDPSYIKLTKDNGCSCMLNLDLYNKVFKTLRLTKLLYSVMNCIRNLGPKCTYHKPSMVFLKEKKKPYFFKAIKK